jgi:HlyD family secretion protein
MQTNPSNIIESKNRSQNRLKKLPKRVWWIALAAVIIVAVAVTYLTIHTQQASAASTSQQAPLQTAVARQGNLVLRASGTGTLIAAQEVNLNFKNNGVLQVLNVKVGDQVKAGDLLAQLDDSSQQVALSQAQQALNQLTSPSATATAQLAVTTAEANVITAQTELNSLQHWDNTALIQDEYARVVIAKANLDKAQAAYDSGNVGTYINNPGEASLYQALYNAQQAYNTAQTIYSAYSQKPTQRQLDAAKANLALANATLTEDENYVAALTGGTVPANATGNGLNQLFG